MKQFLLVFLGGGFGSLLRYLISKNLNTGFQNFFWGTFTVNILGCLLIGIVLGLSKGNYLNQNQILLLSAGFCGGFTTFSTFALENHSLLQSGQFLHFSLYTLISIVVGILAMTLGLWITKFI